MDRRSYKFARQNRIIIIELDQDSEIDMKTEGFLYEPLSLGLSLIAINAFLCLCSTPGDKFLRVS